MSRVNISSVNIAVHFDNDKDGGMIGVRTLSSIPSKPIAINFNYDVTVWLTEAQLRDLAAKIESELQDRMAETIRLAAGNPQLIADLKKNWKPQDAEAIQYSNVAPKHHPGNPAPRHRHSYAKGICSDPFCDGMEQSSPEAETAAPHRKDDGWYNPETGFVEVDNHARANADQVEMLEKETNNA